jgi:SAM-dependent methyltransferase
MLKTNIRSFIAHPLARDVDLDSPETTNLRRRIIQDKSFLKKFYRECYASIIKSLPRNVHGPVLEMGSGGGFLKDYIADLIASDILQIPLVDIVLDARRLPFDQAKLRGIVMLNVLHHLSLVDSFFSRALDCVKPGGVIIMIEPWVTRWSRLVYKYLHHEPFEPDFKGWNIPPGGPLSVANSALPWIMFQRDRKLFEDTFPDWQISEIELHTPFCYFLSGGVSMRSFVPGGFYPIFRKIEHFLKPWMHHWAMFAKIVLVRSKFKKRTTHIDEN